TVTLQQKGCMPQPSHACGHDELSPQIGNGRRDACTSAGKRQARRLHLPILLTIRRASEGPLPSQGASFSRRERIRAARLRLSPTKTSETVELWKIVVRWA